MAALKRTGFAVTVFAFTMLAVWLLSGCSREVIRYAPVPADLIPPAPKYESVEPAEVMCLTASAYERLARNFLSCKRYGAELRALVGGEP